jgi:hypothetical protein
VDTPRVIASVSAGRLSNADSIAANCVFAASERTFVPAVNCGVKL